MPVTPDRAPRAAALVVVNPSGNRSRVPVTTVPFQIGRHADNQLVLRDNRVSRGHARIVADGDGYAITDLGSRHGIYVNGARVEKQPLHNGDLIEFGFPDSYKLTFNYEEDELSRILDQFQPPAEPAAGATSNLGKLRALVEVARALQSSLSINDVLAAVVDAAMAVTATERGFLLLKKENDLDVTVARDRGGVPLASTDLKVPMTVINRALKQRRELLSMSFDPLEEQGLRPDTSVAHLELRSVVCVPLVRIRAGSTEETGAISANNETVGLLYMDSRLGHADLSHGNRELLQTLALEASTILENARLLEQERLRARLEEELEIARQIQTGLLPSNLPKEGWFRVAGSTVPSHQVGGDYFDVRNISEHVWATIVADVSGKGVSSALLASFLQGAFLLASDDPPLIEEMMLRVNLHLNERTRGEKYATVFYSTLKTDGTLHWANAGHCAPLVLRPDGRLRTLQTTGLPVGMLEVAKYGVEEIVLEAGDKVVIFSDGITEAENAEGKFFGNDRLRTILRENSGVNCDELHARILHAVEEYTEGAMLSDDVTLVIFEYVP